MCYDDHHTTSSGVNKLDILFVTHTAGSLDHDRPMVAAQIQNFVAGLPAGVDYRIGVMLGHAHTQYAGQLYTADHTGAALNSNSMSLSAIGQEVYYRLTHVVQEAETSGGEANEYSLYKSLTSNLASVQGQDFYRADAGLAVVMITNERDICATSGPDFPAGEPAETNPVEVNFWNCNCKNTVSSQIVVDKLKQVKGTMPLKVGGVLFSSESNLPAGVENELGAGPLNMVQEMGANGFIADMSNLAGISAALNPIKSMISTAALQTHFLLQVPSSHLDRNSIHVFVNGVEVYTWWYDPSDSSITLASCTPGLMPGVCVEIKYCETMSH